MNNMIDLRSNPAARQQVQAVRSGAARPSTTATATAAAAPRNRPPRSGCRNSETLRATGAVSERSTPPSERRSSPICKQSRRFEGADS